jgi:hypothetical protein
MDWLFFLILGAVLFVLIVGVLVLRYFWMLRLEEEERKAEIEQEARETAETNSGL